jgi:hypothetical protein
MLIQMKKNLREEFRRLKETVQKILKPKKKQAQLVLQPCQNKKRFF